MQLVFMMTAKCNASCLHCSTSCGPNRDEHLTPEQMENLIRQAADLSADEPLEISLTGGEPFLDFELLRRVIAYGHSHGALMTCVSNGYWATSHERAIALLGQLKSGGLSILAISTSVFHQRFVPRARVDRALAAARTVGLECVLKYVRTSADPEIDAITEGASTAGADRTEILPLMPTLREHAQLPDSDYVRRPGLPSGTCPGAVINVGEDGRVYASRGIMKALKLKDIFWRTADRSKMVGGDPSAKAVPVAIKSATAICECGHEWTIIDGVTGRRD